MALGVSLPISMPGRLKRREAVAGQLRCVDDRERQLTDLMIRGLKGDAEAYRSTLQGLVPVIIEFLSEKTGGKPSDFEELVQEILIAAHLRRQTYCPERGLLRSIHAIADQKLSMRRK